MVDKFPPRSDVLLATSMLCTFDVDCGELLPGHRFIARGLSGPSEIPLPWSDQEEPADDEGERDADDAVENEDIPDLRSDGQIAVDMAGRSGYPAFSLEYEFVPGIPPLRDGDSFFDYLIGISYDADVPLPWEGDDDGAIAPYEGGPSTHGSRGEWPLPPDAQVLTFTLYPPLRHVRRGVGRGVRPRTCTCGPARRGPSEPVRTLGARIAPKDQRSSLRIAIPI